MSKGADGTAYEYKVEEAQASKDANPDYDSAVTSEGTAWTITNKHKPGTNTESTASFLLKTSDNIPLVPIAVVAVIAVVVLCTAAWKRRKQ